MSGHGAPEDPRLTQIRALILDEADGIAESTYRRLLEHLGAPPVDAIPPQGIDRAALWEVYDRYSIPNDVQEERGLSFDDFADAIVALVRPVEGVTEVDIDLLHDCAVACQKHGLDGTARRLLGLAARLEAAS